MECLCVGVFAAGNLHLAAYFVIGEVFFGVLYNLLGVLGRETGVVLGAILTFFGVASRLGDGDDFVATAAAAVLDLLVNNEKTYKKFALNYEPNSQHANLDWNFFAIFFATHLLAG